MKVIENMMLEIVTLSLLVINLYMFFIQSVIARIQQTTQEEFDVFWRTLSILSLIILIILVVVYIVSVKVFKRTIGKTLLGVVILLAVNVIILVLTNATTVLIFVAAVLYIVYLVQTIVNIRKRNCLILNFPLEGPEGSHRLPCLSRCAYVERLFQGQHCTIRISLMI